MMTKLVRVSDVELNLGLRFKFFDLEVNYCKRCYKISNYFVTSSRNIDLNSYQRVQSWILNETTTCTVMYY